MGKQRDRIELFLKKKFHFVGKQQKHPQNRVFVFFCQKSSSRSHTSVFFQLLNDAL